MKLRQYVYFGLWSETLDAEQMAARIGVEPDRVRVRGSSARGTPERPVPRTHSWQIHAGDPLAYVGAQVEEVLSRIQSARDELRRLIADSETTRASLEIVRHFGDSEGQQQTPEGLNPFGWALSPEVIQFLAYVGANLDIDEYDYLDDESGQAR